MRGRPISFNREEVLAKAMTLFWKQGYHNTGMSDLLNHMEIQRQSFYNTFGSKENVFLEAVALYTHNTLNEITNALNAPGNPLDNVRQVFGMWHQMVEGETPFGCMLGNSIAEFGLNHPEISGLLKAKFDRLEEAFRQAFTRAIDEGLIPDTKDAEAMAKSLMAMGQGMSLLSRLGYGKEMVAGVVKAAEELITG